MPSSNEVSCLKKVRYKMYEQRSLEMSVGERRGQRGSLSWGGARCCGQRGAGCPDGVSFSGSGEFGKNLRENHLGNGCVHGNWCFVGIVYKLCACSQTPLYSERIWELKEKKRSPYILRCDFTAGIYSSAVTLYHPKLNVIADIKASV